VNIYRRTRHKSDLSGYGSWFYQNYFGKKHHIAHHDNGKVYLCGCIAHTEIQGRLTGFGYRSVVHNIKRNDYMYLDL